MPWYAEVSTMEECMDMSTGFMASQARVAGLADAALLARLRLLLDRDGGLTAQLLIHLGEVDARKLYLRRAHGSLFAYCVEALHMSESEAFVRVAAARVAREYPVVLSMLAKRELHLTAVRLLGPHMTKENHREVLRAARFKSKRQIEALLAARAAKPDVPDRVRKLPQRGEREPVTSRSLPLDATQDSAMDVPDLTAHDRGMSQGESETGSSAMSGHASSPGTSPAVQVVHVDGSGHEPQRRGAPSVHAGGLGSLTRDPDGFGGSDIAGRMSQPSASRANAHAPTPAAGTATTASAGAGGAELRGSGAGSRGITAPRRGAHSVSPLSASRYKVEFTADQGFRTKLEQAQALLRHQIPGGELAAVLEQALDSLIASGSVASASTVHRPAVKWRTLTAGVGGRDLCREHS
jgi:hypothetical protein